MAIDRNTASINIAAIQEMLKLPKIYGPNGFFNILDGATSGPPADLVAALERLETAAVDPTLLTGGQTVASVQTQTITDLNLFSTLTRDLLGAAAGPAAGSANQRQAIARIVYPGAVASLLADAKLFTSGDTKPPVTVIDPSPPPASGVEQYQVTNITTGVSDWQDGQFYSGPVATLRNQFIAITTDNINVTATKPSNFIHTGSGNDAIDISLFQGSGGGTNVVDGGGGSNFIVVSIFGNSIDTIFIDARNAAADIWSTVSNFHKGDAVTIYGVTPSALTLDWEDSQGAAGFTGLTLHAIEQGKPIASLTLARYTKADLGNGRLGVSFGTDPAIGSDYLYIQGTAF